MPEFVRSKVAVFVELAKQRSLLARQAELLRRREQAAQDLAGARAALVRDLEFKNRELESFSYAISHDLRAPLRRIDGFAKALGESGGTNLEPRGAKFLARIQESTAQMLQLIDDVLHLSRVTCAEMRCRELDLSAMVLAIAERLREEDPARPVEFRIRPGVQVAGDPALLRIALQNLLENAWKFTSKVPVAQIDFGLVQANGQTTYFVRDNGAGFEMTQTDRLFRPFQRLHLASEFPGAGIGLATVRRIIHRHGGTVWAESAPGDGACFYWTLAGTPRAMFEWRARESCRASRLDGVQGTLRLDGVAGLLHGAVGHEFPFVRRHIGRVAVVSAVPAPGEDAQRLPAPHPGDRAVGTIGAVARHVDPSCGGERVSEVAVGAATARGVYGRFGERPRRLELAAASPGSYELVLERHGVGPGDRHRKTPRHELLDRVTRRPE